MCQASLARFSWAGNGLRSLLLFSNPNGKNRLNLTVKLSDDEGRTWSAGRSVYAGSSAYSCLAALPDGRIGVLYERDDYQKLTFASLTLQWLTGGKD